MRNFEHRHIGTTKEDREAMLAEIGVPDIESLIAQTVPESIRLSEPLNIPEGLTERAFLKRIRKQSEKNSAYRSYIGQGYYGTITPSPILRNIFENPGWYTQYTPYQAEISQGRLEALLNFQTVISDLTGLPIANASLLDEGTAAGEAMTMFHDVKNKRAKENPAKKIFVDQHVFPQTVAVLKSRAEPLDIEVVIGDRRSFSGGDDFFAILCQYPNARGAVEDYRDWVTSMREQDIYVIVAADLLSLTMLLPPGEWGADAVVGSSQRFGVPMGFGGPHAAFFATREEFKRVIPGRIIGVSQDSRGRSAVRMALQTREQHIKREKATSNICTAQALLAIMAGMYAVYHGPDGLKSIGKHVHQLAVKLAKGLQETGAEVVYDKFFDTVCVRVFGDQRTELQQLADKHEMNFYHGADAVHISLDETVLEGDVDEIIEIFRQCLGEGQPKREVDFALPNELLRTSEYCTHPVFSSYNTETELMRYMRRLEGRDLSLTETMIPLGSCTMKLNAATQLEPVSWHKFANIHPYAPPSQTVGYMEIIGLLEKYLCEITGLDACSLMPNSGAQGELTGLLTIRAYHKAHGNEHRNVALIPSSAHGTNPASAVMAGMKVVVVACDDNGNIDVDDLKKKAEENKETLSALMVTYPSTHGVYEEAIKEICAAVHENGGLVYMDGANMNAQVGLTAPGEIDVDVCHLNLHKTFAIPHGGGGPGMGPICVNAKLKPFLPGHLYSQTTNTSIEAVASAPYGSASILLISYAYIELLGAEGLRRASENAILNANYLAARLSPHYPVLYHGANGFVAHEFILDLRPFKAAGVTAEDVAKRLIDYGFHAPTLSFPVYGTFMIEPTESESKAELDLFCEAMIQIKEEIEEVVRGDVDKDNNVLVNAPHTVDQLTESNWNFPYTREKAVFPLPYLFEQHKFWPAVSRVDNAYGDRNLVCTCPPIEEYMETEVQESS